MSPTQSRFFFAGFTLVMSFVVINAHRQTPRVATAVSASAVSATAPAARPLAATTAATTAVLAPVGEPRGKSAEDSGLPDAKTQGPHAAQEPIKLAAVGEPVRIPTRLPNAAMVGQLPLPSVVDADVETIRRLQKDLVDAGYGPLVVNGAAGPLTRAAVMAFEYDHAMALTGEASERILKRLAAVGGPAQPAEPDQRRISTQEAEQVVLIVQKSLQSLGTSLTVDGRLGPETEAAIRSFETAHGLKVTGRVSAGLFGVLGRAVARSRGDGG
jgi:peptidoglycan hydrolase-like protein with peptidoglycan-binding domain